MENTNLDEENSDAAAYGLVALCDSNFDDGTENQVSEETVETSKIVSELGGINAVQLFIQNIQQQQSIFQQQQQLQKNEANDYESGDGSQLDLENEKSQIIEIDAATAIAIVQESGGTEENSGIDIQSLQAVAEAIEKSGVKVKVEGKKSNNDFNQKKLGLSNYFCITKLSRRRT